MAAVNPVFVPAAENWITGVVFQNPNFWVALVPILVPFVVPTPMLKGSTNATVVAVSASTSVLSIGASNDHQVQRVLEREVPVLEEPGTRPARSPLLHRQSDHANRLSDDRGKETLQTRESIRSWIRPSETSRLPSRTSNADGHRARRSECGHRPTPETRRCGRSKTVKRYP